MRQVRGKFNPSWHIQVACLIFLGGGRVDDHEIEGGTVAGLAIESDTPSELDGGLDDGEPSPVPSASCGWRGRIARRSASARSARVASTSTSGTGSSSRTCRSSAIPWNSSRFRRPLSERRPLGGLLGPLRDRQRLDAGL